MSDDPRLSRRTIISGGSATIGVAALFEGCSSPEAVGERAAVAATDSFAGLRSGDERKVWDVGICWCPPGSFRMGSPAIEPQRRSDERQVGVTLTSGFWVGKFPVTQALWAQVAGAFPGALSAGAGNDFPLYNVNFAEAEGFCDQLTAMAHTVGDLPGTWTFRLPTEAQWEYACRAGTTTATAFGDQLSSYQANFRGDHPYNSADSGPSLSRTVQVGAYSPNAWGLHDMHGNVWEWCRDWYHRRLPGGTNPDLWSAGETSLRNSDGSISRVRRGGCWADQGWACRSGCRLRYEPERRADHIGFRVVAFNRSS